jgi:hypothetical protein
MEQERMYSRRFAADRAFREVVRMFFEHQSLRVAGKGVAA